MDGEKSYEGIVVNKPAGKAAMAGESAQASPMQALIQKAGTWCEARNRGREADHLGKPACARQKPESQEVRRTGAEQTGRPSGASTKRGTGKARRLYDREIQGKENET